MEQIVIPGDIDWMQANAADRDMFVDWRSTFSLVSVQAQVNNDLPLLSEL